MYFDNGCSTQKLQSVIDTVSNYYKEENSNVHRGVHFLSGLQLISLKNLESS